MQIDIGDPHSIWKGQDLASGCTMLLKLLETTPLEPCVDRSINVHQFNVERSIPLPPKNGSISAKMEAY